MGGVCQNYGPFLGPLIRPRIRPRIIIGTQKETIILIIPHIGTVQRDSTGTRFPHYLRSTSKMKWRLFFLVGCAESHGFRVSG